MKYRELQPTPELAESVECFWFLHGNGDPASIPPQRILPDGCVELILNFADPFCEKTPAGFARQPLHFLVGQMDRPMEIMPTGRTDLMGVRFHPSGAMRILGLPMSELTGQVVPIDALHRKLADALQDACMAKSDEECLKAVETALSRNADAGPVDPAVKGALRQMLQSDGCASVESLARAVGLSRRQLERKFQEWVGLSPKMLGRILRFQKVFKALESGANWAEIAADCGYYDQSHLIRDFRQFAGECPSTLLVPQDSLTEVFMRKNRVTQFSNTAGQA